VRSVYLCNAMQYNCIAKYNQREPKKREPVDTNPKPHHCPSPTQPNVHECNARASVSYVECLNTFIKFRKTTATHKINNSQILHQQWISCYPFTNLETLLWKSLREYSHLPRPRQQPPSFKSIFAKYIVQPNI